ncbi:hypothetical protein [Homoserinibacter sp. YIM 151385]|uniref:hypothetical protein n=1 Tax=Homoserinibacter sp. YIM 151385 TaxID=2985506 RepID=UPI0022F08998|nr:hypothetical protein [Homoserinibacter sp. YIM 151385]WBU37654.1 hypothetical protein OF852_12140 [Homoserinibacter sp. YIM 151385]
MRLDNRLWILITAILSVGLLAGGWFIGVAPSLAVAAAADLEREDTVAQNDDLRAQLTELESVEGTMPTLEGELEDLRTAIPAGVSGSSFIAEVNELADKADVTLTSIAIGEPAPYVPPGPPPSTEPEAPAEGEESEEAASGPVAGAAAAGVAPAGPIPLTDPLVTSESFLVVQVELRVEGDQGKVRDFLSRLQEGERLVLVTKFNYGNQDSAGEGGSVGAYSVAATGLMYAFRDTTAAAAPAVEQAAG